MAPDPVVSAAALWSSDKRLQALVLVRLVRHGGQGSIHVPGHIRATGLLGADQAQQGGVKEMVLALWVEQEYRERKRQPS